MLFLNSHPAFSILRSERATKHSQGEEPKAFSMANGLKKHSARGEKYIREVKSMVKTNKEYIDYGLKKENATTILSKVESKSN